MQLFKIDTTHKFLKKITESTLAKHGFTEPRDLEAWLLNHDSEILGRHIRWIMRQDFLNTDQRSDLIGVDESGELIICELKQGNVFQDAVTQALGYASEYSQLDIEALSNKLLEHCQKGHIKDVTPTTFEDAKSLINAVVTQNEPGTETRVNDTQSIILIGENFDATVLSIADYLNSSSNSDDLNFVIECWRYQLFLVNSNEYQIGFEQILPPPNIRDQIADRREENRSRKYARDPNRIRFMASFMQAVNSAGILTASRSPGSSYQCKLSLKDRPGKQFSFSLYSDHPKISFPISIDTANLGTIYQDKISKEGDINIMELEQYSSSSLPQNSEVVSTVTDFIKKISNAGV